MSIERSMHVGDFILTILQVAHADIMPKCLHEALSRIIAKVVMRSNQLCRLMYSVRIYFRNECTELQSATQGFSSAQGYVFWGVLARNS